MKNIKVLITLKELDNLKKQALAKNTKAIELLKAVYLLGFEIMEIKD